MGLGAWLVQSGTSQGAAEAPATTQFHWQDPSLSTESSRGEKPSAGFSSRTSVPIAIENEHDKSQLKNRLCPEVLGSILCRANFLRMRSH